MKIKTTKTYVDSGRTVTLDGFRVELDRPGRIDGGKWTKPRYVLRYWADDSPRMIPIHNTGEKRPTGLDLEQACSGLGLTVEQVYAIPVRD